MAQVDDPRNVKLGKSCTKCGSFYDASLAFCPADGTKLPDELTQADSMVRLAVLTTPDVQSTLINPSLQQAKLADAALASARPESMLNETIDHRYQLLSIVGSGGMSVVYKGNDLYLKKIVAVKMLLPQMLAFAGSLERFRREAHAASTIDHPNVVKVTNFGIMENGTAYLVMDFIDGVPLSDLFSVAFPLTIDRALRIFAQVADALAQAHNMGIVHRDLKPTNIIVIRTDIDGEQAKLVDFGIAKLTNQEGEEAFRLTQTGEVFGSPLYMSPEQCRGENLDWRADIYSLGCVMYEALVGEAAHDGNNSLEVMFKHTNEVPPPMNRNGRKSIPQRLERIVFKAIAKEPNERYQTMEALRNDLLDFEKSMHHGLFSKLKDRLELIWLKRRPKTRHEKLIATTCGVLVVCICALLVHIGRTYWLAMNSKALKTHPTWVDPAKPGSIALVSEGDLRRYEFTAGFIQSQDPMKRVKSMLNVGMVRMDAGQLDGAVESLENAVRLSTEVHGRESFTTVTCLEELAMCYFKRGEFGKAETVYKEVLYNPHTLMQLPKSLLAVDLYLYGQIQAMQGTKSSLMRADLAYTKALKVWTQEHMYSSLKVMRVADNSGSFDDFPTEAPTDRFVTCLARLADLRFATGDFEHAEKYYEHALSYWKASADSPGTDEEIVKNRNPFTIDTVIDSGLACERLAELNAHLRRFDRADDFAKRAIGYMERIAPARGKYNAYFASAVNDRSQILWRSNRWVDAALEYYRALNIYANSD